jgi:hypothetical protein
MAVGVVMDFEGATSDQYDEVVRLMGFSPRGAGAPGCVFHWVAKTDGGLRITDVWETREQFEASRTRRSGPCRHKPGSPARPR